MIEPHPVAAAGDAAAVARTSRGLRRELGDAIRGTGADYTKIPLRRAVFLLAVPMVLELVLELTFAVVDIWFVARLGASAVATVGLTESFLFLLYAIGVGLAMAVTAVVARRTGEGDRQAAAISAAQAIWIAVLASLPFAVIGVVFARELLQLMDADPWTLTHGVRYLQWMLGSNVVIMLLFVCNAVFRGAGDAAVAMRVLWVANGLNIVLDPILIFGFGPIPALGVEGAAIATVIGRGSGAAMQLVILLRGSQHIRVAAAQFAIEAGTLWHIVRTSLGGVGQMIVAMTAWIFLMRILAAIGSDAVAGATIAMRLMMFTLMPAWGMSNAAATLVGQNLGAGEPGRAEASVWRIGWYNMAFTVAVSVIFFLFPSELMQLFTAERAVVDVGAEWLRILSYSYFVYGWWMVAVQAFNGAGDTVTPTKINLVFFWLIQIPLAWLLALRLDLQATGVFWAVFVSETSVGLFTLWLFTRGPGRRCGFERAAQSASGHAQELAPRLRPVGSEVRFGILEVGGAPFRDRVARGVPLHLCRGETVHLCGVQAEDLCAQRGSDLRIPVPLAQRLGDLEGPECLDLIRGVPHDAGGGRRHHLRVTPCAFPPTDLGAAAACRLVSCEAPAAAHHDCPTVSPDLRRRCCRVGEVPILEEA
jgi:putative MATE family efflux protein